MLHLAEIGSSASDFFFINLISKRFTCRIPNFSAFQVLIDFNSRHLLFGNGVSCFRIFLLLLDKIQLENHGYFSCQLL